MNKIDKNKKYETKSGLPVRIYATDGEGIYSVHGAIMLEDGWTCWGWKKNGEDRNDDYSLVEKKKEKEVWIELFWVESENPYVDAVAYRSKQDAEKDRDEYTIEIFKKTVKI